MENLVLEILAHWGLKADKLLEDNLNKSPDFLVEDGGYIHLVELKTREDSADRQTRHNNALDLGELFTEHMPIVRRNTLSGIVRDASKQLSSRNEYSVDFRLVWLMPVGMHLEAKVEQIQSSLYGLTGIVDIENRDAYRRKCYFFTDSDFFRFRHVLDAAVISWNGNAKLCLNPHSPRYQEFKTSGLFSVFGDKACDPIQQEKSGEAYIVDSPVDRNNEREVLDYLEEKYKVGNLMRLDVGYTSVSAGIDE